MKPYGIPPRPVSDLRQWEAAEAWALQKHIIALFRRGMIKICCAKWRMKIDRKANDGRGRVRKLQPYSSGAVARSP